MPEENRNIFDKFVLPLTIEEQAALLLYYRISPWITNTIDAHLTVRKAVLDGMNDLALKLAIDAGLA